MDSKIEELRKLAAEKGGRCLSSSYHGIRGKLRWKCAKGHEWEATPETVKLGYWCAPCNGVVRTTIQDLHAHAEKMGGRCLSLDYTNPKARYHWQCSDGHTWWASWSSIRYSGTWCPECGRRQAWIKRGKYTIETLQHFAHNKGGKCLSEEYMGFDKHHKWECASGHKWEANCNNIFSNKTWCPLCASGTGERICRTFFEQLLKSEFPKVRPKWLRSDRGYPMELDGYSKELGIAFEHQGTQHFVDRKHFKDDFFGTGKPSKFKAIQKRDALKAQLCEQRGILLIQVPSVLEVLGVENLKDFIRTELLRNHYPLPTGFDDTEVNPDMAYNFDKLAELKDLAVSRDGLLLSTEYFDTKRRYLWQCKAGHQWWAKADNVKQGKWCRTCAGLDRKTIGEMQRIASKRGGVCLSEAYGGSQSPLLWRCKEGHEWSAIPNNVLRGSWCPKCRDKKTGEKKRRYQLEDLVKFAQSKGGESLSKRYTITHAKYPWKCTKGHCFEMTFDKVMQGYWCPYCAGNAKKTLSDLQNAAQARGGRCLSPAYRNIKTKYEWECKYRHTWKATAESVLRGTWCPYCASSARS
ncbi:zinc-ribbon domain-containing protein [Pontibacter cellulosilyticus]|uniref:Treble clef zinc finger domain-containing protein n=1 Tax=Pontibacter cellulosilyticus TaxID=1720253 RepID=A0A923N5X5_9BACT|nr:hypothetical protein [Pontibacter cellulosilyticus]MBC5992414.1 hypothetical protein [Pontibacter cellulosilyticus]